MIKDDFVVIKDEKGDVVRFTLKGHLDKIGAPELKYELENVINDRRRTKIILNMTHVVYICSIGAKVILASYEQAKRAGGELSVERPSEIVRNVLGKSALDKMKTK